ncbi:alkaline phosphatase [Sphingomonas sp. DBB INV C78]|uniref:DedA family protein n=1 Tax=Sphingomonas sp. DBB INV C78 TaxID=3349434 RepID=UPI0036D2994D
MGEWVRQLIEQSGYLGVAFLMFAETVFPPIPSEVIMSLAGLQAAKGEMTLAGVIACGTAGAMLGNAFWYLLARALGLQRFKPLIDRFGRWLTMDWAEVQRGEKWFNSHGAAFVFFGRLMPTIRSLVSIPAGLLHMSLSRFLFWSTLGTAGWTALLATAGYMLGQRYTEVDEYIGPVSTAIIFLLALWYFWRVLTWKPSR